MLYEKIAIHPVDEVATLPVSRPRTRRAWYLPCKVAAEWMITLVLLAIAGPVIAVLALLTKLTSPGPAFYRQVRAGRNGRPFTMYKIRSMRHNCEASTGAVWSSTGVDNRVTRIGRFMRETHLDELPQLIHVLQGHMSIIGPRPERPEIISRLERALPRYVERLAVRPGLTGLAQIQQPADADMEDVRHKLAYDIYYVREMSPVLDVCIALSTVFHLTGLTLASLARMVVCAPGQSAEQELQSITLVPNHGQRVEVA